MRVVLYLLPVIGLLFYACKRDSCIDSPDTSGIEVNVTIDRLDLEMKATDSMEDLEQLLIDNPVFADQYLRFRAYPDPQIPTKQFYERIHHPAFDTLLQEVQTVFGDMSIIEDQLTESFKIIKYYYPGFRVPQIKTTVSGFVKDNYLSDSLIILGLEYYLGPEASFRPDLPQYILKRYQEAYLVPQLMVVHFSRLFNATDFGDQTVLADMIFYGKAYYFARSVMPCAPDSLFTGYTALEMEDIVEHEQVIWAGVLENELLFHNSHEEKNKIFAERPKTLELGENCPGRIGRWIGWRIVQAYMAKHPNTSLRELMEMKDARKLFNESGYKPIPY